MPGDRKPTTQELEEGINKAIEEIDAEESETPQDLPEPTPEDQEEPESPSADGEDLEDTQDDTDEGEDEEETEDEENEPAQDRPKVTAPPVDYEKRYRDSTREAHILAEGKKQLEEEIDAVQDLPEPTQAELLAEYPDWDILSDTEKKLAKKVLHGDMKERKIQEIRDRARADGEKTAQRAREVETFAIHPDTLSKFPKLEGHQEEFVTYASKPSRLVLDLEDLAKLFILDLPEPKKNKGKMLEVGSGGPNDKAKPKGNKISVEQSEILRNTDYKKYTEYLKQGRIDNTIE